MIEYEDDTNITMSDIAESIRWLIVHIDEDNDILDPICDILMQWYYDTPDQQKMQQDDISEFVPLLRALYKCALGKYNEFNIMMDPSISVDDKTTIFDTVDELRDLLDAEYHHEKWAHNAVSAIVLLISISNEDKCRIKTRIEIIRQIYETMQGWEK
jgi:hypothetical protein